MNPILRAEQINHLAHYVLEVDNQLVVEEDQPLRLLLEEVFELVASDDPIVIQIDDTEPVLYARSCRFVFLGQDEPYEVSEAHAFFVLLELSSALGKDAFNCLP